ncbi:MAG: response regulator [Proteobacteria bacterium]|nr:response regulator [Pseudomonadota bacterium]
MLREKFILIVVFGYLIILFLIAYFADRLKEKGKSLAANPYIYSFSLAVYCTAWTFYGSVGLFSKHGYQHILVYIGPTFAAFTWWHTLRKIILIAKQHNITSIADFISTRYGKSTYLAGFITIMLTIGMLPYIALQLKAISSTLNILFFSGTKQFSQVSFKEFYLDHAFHIAILLSIFGALFGARKLDVTERHEGMVIAIAFEAFIKLIAFVAVGFYITYLIFDGYKDILNQGLYFLEIKELYNINTPSTPDYFQWFNLMLLSGIAVMFLPRQFHISVIENYDVNHIKKAMYIFPLYLFLINFFVPAISIGGRLLGFSINDSDLFVLLIPIARGEELLSLFAFIGGFSAATGMLIVETVTLSTMILNHIISPVIVKITFKKINLSFLLIHIKRFLILLVMVLGYIYFKIIPEKFILVDIGLMSFCAILQLAPAIFLGIYWNKVNKIGAFAGIMAGYLIWFYTLFIPSLINVFPKLENVIKYGPLGIEMLKPQALFYLKNLDIWSHSIFWSLTFNFLFLISFSVLTKQSQNESILANSFVNIDKKDLVPEITEQQHIDRSPSLEEYKEFLSKFIGKTSAEKAIQNFIETNNIPKPYILTSSQELQLRTFVEKTLAAHLGGPTATIILDNFLKIFGTKVVKIFDIFQDVSESLKESRQALAIRLKELSLLYSSLEKLMTSIDKETIMNNAIEMLISNFNADACAIALFDEDKKLRIKKQKGLSEIYINFEFDMEKSFAGKSFEENRVIFIESLQHIPFPPQIKNLEDGGLVESLAVAPILYAGTPMGVIIILNKTKRFYTEQFKNFFKGLANQIGLALKNAQLYQELTQLNQELEKKVSERTIELERKSLLLEEANKHLQEIDKLKSQFLATMSHELRTPLNSIIGYTQLILDGVDGPLSPEQKEDLQRIERNAKHLLQLINDILDLSKIEAGKMELNITKVDLLEVFDQVISIIKPLISGRPIEIETKYETPSCFVLADRQRLEQILLNLLSNSAKFTERGKITIGFRKIFDMIKKPWVEIFVSDTGIGISKENLDKIFKAFKQLEDTSTRKYGGTGLGLSITKKLVEMHGGAIWVESTPGKGTTMTFTMPAATEGETFYPYRKEVFLSEVSKSKTHKVLIIEEREDILQIIYDFLSKEGYEVDYANLQNAMDKIVKEKPMSIVIDLMLSEQEGWKLLRMLKENKETTNIPIILISVEGDTKMGYTIGPIDYIIKPLIQEEVIRELKKIEKSLESKIVYIVDDDPDALRLLEKIVKEAGYEVKTITSGKEVIEYLTIERPGLILLDLFMPEITGFDVIEYIRKTPNLSGIPIIIITGGDLTKEQREFLDDGKLKIFFKTKFTSEELCKEIKKILDRFSE